MKGPQNRIVWFSIQFIVCSCVVKYLGQVEGAPLKVLTGNTVNGGGNPIGCYFDKNVPNDQIITTPKPTTEITTMARSETEITTTETSERGITITETSETEITTTETSETEITTTETSERGITTTETSETEAPQPEVPLCAKAYQAAKERQQKLYEYYSVQFPFLGEKVLKNLIGDFSPARCDAQGYYMPVQCHLGGCYCVDPVSGEAKKFANDPQQILAPEDCEDQKG